MCILNFIGILCFLLNYIVKLVDGEGLHGRLQTAHHTQVHGHITSCRFLQLLQVVLDYERIYIYISCIYSAENLYYFTLYICNPCMCVATSRCQDIVSKSCMLVYVYVCIPVNDATL